MPFRKVPEPIKTLQMKKKSKERDRHLDAPAEANRDKHINFVALETGDSDPANQMRTEKTGRKNPKNNRKKSGLDSPHKRT